jgi:hypothetical protein
MAHDRKNYLSCECDEPGCGSFRPFGDATMRELDAPDPCGFILGEVDGRPVMCGFKGVWRGFCWAHRGSYG